MYSQLAQWLKEKMKKREKEDRLLLTVGLMLTGVYTCILQATAANVLNCIELYGNTPRKSDEKAKHKHAMKSLVVVLSFFY